MCSFTPKKHTQETGKMLLNPLSWHLLALRKKEKKRMLWLQYVSSLELEFLNKAWAVSPSPVPCQSLCSAAFQLIGPSLDSDQPMMKGSSSNRKKKKTYLAWFALINKCCLFIHVYFLTDLAAHAACHSSALPVLDKRSCACLFIPECYEMPWQQLYIDFVDVKERTRLCGCISQLLKGTNVLLRCTLDVLLQLIWSAEFFCFFWGGKRWRLRQW